jgi:hypothetical protein
MTVAMNALQFITSDEEELRSTGDRGVVMKRMGIVSLGRVDRVTAVVPPYCIRLSVALERSKGFQMLERKRMRLWWKGCIFALFCAAPMLGFSASCTTQAELTPQDRAVLAAEGEKLSIALLQQDLGTLQSALLPSLSSEWENIRAAVEQAEPLVKGGKAQLRNAYLLDASTLNAQSDTQFFCSNANGTLTVTISMRSLPPGRYALILADAAGAPLAGQIGIILVSDTTSSAPAWKLGGISVRQGSFEGHDGLWYWTRARELAHENMPWAAYYCFEVARYLQIPVDFLTSPNLDKLNQEQAQIKGAPVDVFPYTLAGGERNWKIDSVRLDASLRQADLGVTYESAGSADPAVARTEAMSVLSALLKAHPGIKQNFHGMWAYASTNGKVTPVIELPMTQIP